jgi:hypothetical protein
LIEFTLFYLHFRSSTPPLLFLRHHIISGRLCSNFIGFHHFSLILLVESVVAFLIERFSNVDFDCGLFAAKLYRVRLIKRQIVLVFFFVSFCAQKACLARASAARLSAGSGQTGIWRQFAF